MLHAFMQPACHMPPVCGCKIGDDDPAVRVPVASLRPAPAKKPKRGTADDPICRLFGYYVVVIGDSGPENCCRFHKKNPCPHCGRTDDSK